MFLTGKKVVTGQFSHDNTESLIRDYVENTRKLSDRRWKQILERCGTGAEIEPEEDFSGMDDRRRILYIPSSPGPDEE